MSQQFLGQILAVGFSFAPRGWSIANGAVLSIAQSSALFSLLGTAYGGNGQTTFGLPNLQGRVAIGKGQGPGTSAYQLGQMAGTESTTLTIAEMPRHNHAATTTVTPTSTLAASTAINVVTAPSAKVPTPVGNILSVGTVSGAGTAVNAYAAPGEGTPGTMAAGATTTTLSGSVTATAVTTVDVNGANQPVGILQPYLAINYIIALVGIFPSRN